ncbi:MAG: FAD:protein FMN transferase [Christensenellaceae bacterium]|nr:FAD:protein FMN transferase [Christensenellaceae bacterium]
MKRILTILLSFIIIFSFVSNSFAAEKHSMHFFDTFDTIITIIGYSDSKEIFDTETQKAQDMFRMYHKYFDIYNEYEGVVNMCTLNKTAKDGPVKVDKELFDFLVYGKKLQLELPTGVNMAMGSVLKEWHDYRTAGINNPAEAKLPSMDSLIELNNYTDINNLELDEEAQTVYYKDPNMLLDTSAVSKGYATEMVADYLAGSSMPSFVISAGGNVKAGISPLDGREFWSIGIQDPKTAQSESNKMLNVVGIKEMAVVTSGDYQRYYIVDGKKYHHIIDSVSLMPADHVKAVTILTENSAMADYLSTALFIMPYEEGFEFVKGLDGVDALWVLLDDTVKMTEGFEKVVID